MHGKGDQLEFVNHNPPIYRTFYMASYRATEEVWKLLAHHFRNTGEARLAKTIEQGIARQKARYPYRADFVGWIWGLRFRDGSIAKMETAIKTVPELAFKTP